MDAAELWCNICPRQPNFSDVSHLLTHVSSKAHLSHYFKLQVRSHQEPLAGQLLHEYNRWYKANNLAKLLSDRMASKEARQKTRQGKAAAKGGTYAVKRELEPKPASNLRQSAHTSLSISSGPRPSRPCPKVEPAPDEEQSASLPLTYFPPATSLISDDCPEIGPQLMSPLGLDGSPERSLAGPWKREYDSDSGDDSGPFVPAAAGWTGRNRSDAKIDPRLLQSDLSSDPFVDTVENSFDNEISRERADEIARLKGVLWPGMDVFDSATEHMRRKRNQKKDQNALRKMEETSLCVEPTELVFSPSGILRKERVINGNVDDYTPLKGETPIPKRRPVRPKRLLFSQVDPNIGPRRGHERKRAKKLAGHCTDRYPKRPNRRGCHSIRDATSQLPLYFRGFDSSLGDGDDEFDLTIKGFDQKPRSRFTVFQDDNDSIAENRHQKDRTPFSPSRPSRPFISHCDTMAFEPFQSSTAGNHAANITGRTPCHSADKENIEPILDAHNRIDPVDSWRPPFSKFNYSSDTGLPPHFFFGDVPHTPLGPFDSQDLPGYSLNPLAISLPRLPVQEKENTIYNADISPMYTRQTTAREPSPDETISDVEQDDFERLYLDGSSY